MFKTDLFIFPAKQEGSLKVMNHTTYKIYSQRQAGIMIIYNSFLLSMPWMRLGQFRKGLYHQKSDGTYIVKTVYVDIRRP